jgi:hypothetical protein
LRVASVVVGPCPSYLPTTRKALAIWSAAREPQGTPAWTYLFERGVALGALPSRINEALRFHPNCPWHDQRRMCLVALWTDIISGEARAIDVPSRPAAKTSGIGEHGTDDGLCGRMMKSRKT